MAARFTQISATNIHACAIDEGHGVWCWGNNEYGQLGTGDLDGRLVPTRLGIANDWVSISAGQHDTCAIRTPDQL